MNGCSYETATYRKRPKNGKNERMLGAAQRCCTHCGSLHPDDFMEGIRQGASVIPTDKSYKAYIEPPDGGAGDANPVPYGKFYYEHLSKEQAQEFCQLYESGKMIVGNPGYFYSKIYLPQLRES